jgi:hypothetical protein
MFMQATSFNQPLEWNISNVRDMSHMFNSTHAFNQELEWDTEHVEHMRNIFLNSRGRFK